MTTRKPSFDLKLDRAQKHLVDLQSVLTEFARQRPYTVRLVREGKKQRPIWRLHRRRHPDISTSLIAGDFVYNVHSGLDHLAVRLVPSERRTKVSFPIYFEGVWEPSIPGENPERAKARGRWQSTVKKMHPDAIAILKGLQPDDDSDQNTQSINSLLVLRRLSNTDSHKHLPVMSFGMDQAVVHWNMSNGASGTMGPSGTIQHDAVIEGIPNSAVNVQVEGTPLVLVRVTDPQRDIPIPRSCDIILSRARDIVEMLRPYVR